MLPLLILGLLVLGVFYVLTFSSIYPNEKTQKTALKIPKYENADSWEIQNNKLPCLFNFGNCQSPPSKIRFTTQDPWGNIFEAYKNNMGAFGWSTNARVVTSIPTSIVFENKDRCVAEVSEDTTIFTRKQDHTNHFFLITVVCK